MSQDPNAPLLIGLIIDVSSSMRRNAKNSDGKVLPRIEVIKEALNRQFKKASILKGSVDNDKLIEVFCIGMGFQRPMYWSDVQISYDKENALDTDSSEMVDAGVVCDILALSEMVPTKNQLSEIEAQIDTKWNFYAESILGNIELDENVFQELQDYIFKSISKSAQDNKLLKGLHRIQKRVETYNLKPVKLLNLRLLERLQVWEKRIQKLSKFESHRYMENMFGCSREAFDLNKGIYIEFIQHELSDFANSYSAQILHLLTLGHDPFTVIENFDEETISQLAREIYGHLDEELKKKIRAVWFENSRSLLMTALGLGAFINIKVVKELTEKCIQKHSWNTLEEFVHEAVSNTFKERFEAIAKEKMPDWIGLASSREILRNIKQISILMPDGIDETFYSSEFMFGSTPIDEAMNIASLRCLDATNLNKDRVLIIISDGEFETNAQLETAELLKKAGITIICCYVVGKDLVSKMKSTASKFWPQGAKKMFAISSTINESDELLDELSNRGLSIGGEKKMFFQINESGVLDFILEYFLN